MSLLGTLVVALVSTVGDYVWFETGVRHRVAVGVLHGAVLLTAVGGVLGAAAGRLPAGLPLGAAAGAGGALAYYALAPVTGSAAAMLVAWAALWLLLAWLDGRWLRRGVRSPRECLARGAAAAVVGGLAFAAVVGVLWGPPPAGGRDYLTQWLAWLLAWAPGLVAIGAGRFVTTRA